MTACLRGLDNLFFFIKKLNTQAFLMYFLYTKFKRQSKNIYIYLIK